MTNREYDYIIVGAGTSGCVLAHYLSADPTISVLLIEAGSMTDQAQVRTTEAWPMLLGSDLDWDWTSTEQVALNGRKLGVPRGKGLGGSSAINVMMHVEGAAEDYDTWRDLGNPGWGHSDLQPLFRQMERVEGDGFEGRGRDGAMPISRVAAPNDAAESFIKAANACGYRYRPDYNTGCLNGVSWLQSTIGKGERYSAARAFLEPVQRRDNLTVMTRACVLRLSIANQKAEGVILNLNGTPIKAFAHREVVLSAGAVATPKLLMLSGIGPAAHLRAYGINVVADLPGVGQNLSDHPLLPVGMRADCAPLPGTSGVEALLFGRFDGASEGAPDYQINFGSFLFFPPELTGGVAGCTLGAMLCRPASRGTVTLASAEPTDAPLIDLGLLCDARDRKAMLDALKEVRSLGQTAGWPELVGPAGDSDDTQMQYILAMASSNYHLAGTCAMGGSGMAVVDASLKVHQIEGLRVVDASIMPTIVSGNTNATAMAIGAKAAQLMG